MKNKKLIIIVLILIVIAGLMVGKFFASKPQKAQQQGVQQIEYWTCGMHPSVRSDKPGNCPICNMPLIPVYKEGAIVKEEPKVAKRERVYYGCGVKEEDHCPHCDKGIADAECICGEHSFMIENEKINCPVCGKELTIIEPKDVKAAQENMVSRVALKGTQRELAGIKTEALTRHHLTKKIRTVGKIAFDPQLTVAQEEFLTAVETREKLKASPDPDVIRRADDLIEKSRFKLRLLGMSGDEIAELEEAGAAQLNLVLPEGKAWVYADIYEYELAWIKIGQDVLIEAVAYPGEEFKGIIKSMTPVLDPNTRSVKARIETENPDNKLKPEMFVDVIIESVYVAPDGSSDVLAAPKEAILDTGARKIVYVDAGDGEFLGKEVKVGPEGVADVNGREVRLYPILSGLTEGDLIVTKGNFLIDSQSQLTGGMSVLWGGAQEIKTEGPALEPTEPATKHRH